MIAGLFGYDALGGVLAKKRVDASCASPDDIIAMSLLKIRRMQTAGGLRDERQRLLVLDTLQNALTLRATEEMERIRSGRNNASLGSMARIGSAMASGISMATTVFATVLQEAMGSLGLLRVLRIGLEMPREQSAFPRVRLPMAGRRARAAGPCAQRMPQSAGAFRVSLPCMLASDAPDKPPTAMAEMATV